MLIFINVVYASEAAPEEEWNKTFGGTVWGEISSIQQTINGGYIIAGSTKSYGAGDGDFLLIKVSGIKGDFNGEYTIEADIDKNGYVNVPDARMIMQAEAGNIEL